MVDPGRRNQRLVEIEQVRHQVSTGISGWLLLLLLLRLLLLLLLLLGWLLGVWLDS
jgi:hypothetical protein